MVLPCDPCRVSMQHALLHPEFLNPMRAAVISGPGLDPSKVLDTGNDRIVSLFSGVLDRPIARRVIEETGGDQKDFMRRIRSDAARGARDRLRQQGILLLQGNYDANLIKALGLPATSPSEFISHGVASEAERAICAEHGRPVPVVYAP